jgi:O-acetylserine/cysteine efflux transporter
MGKPQIPHLNHHSQYLPIIMMAIVIAYAICFAVIKFGLVYAPPFLFSGLRTLIGGIAILATFPFLKLPLWPKRKLWPWIFLVAAIATTINYAAMFLSIDRGVSVGIASILGNMQPLFIMIMATIFLGERLTSMILFSLAFGISGVVLIFAPTFGDLTTSSVLGIALAVIASGSAAIGSILMKRWDRLSDALSITAWQFVVGSVALIVFSLFTETSRYSYNLLVSSSFLFSLLLLSLIGTAFGSTAWYLLIQRHEIGQLSLYFFLVPVLGLGIALLSGEKLGFIELIGATLIIIGIMISLLLSGKKSEGYTVCR